MKKKIVLPAVLLLLSIHASFAQLYSENFDVDASPNWTFLQAVNPAGNPLDSSVDFFFDYGTVLGIPSAPNSTGGSTRGMRFLCNQSSGFQQGITAFPTGQGFTNNYRLRFDMWLNYVGPLTGGGNGTTQCGSFGIGATGGSIQWPFVAPASIMFGATGEGGSTDDYRCYSNGVHQAATTGIYPAQSRNHNVANGYYTTNFPGGDAAPAAQVSLFPDTQSGTTAAGTIGFKWRDVIVEKIGSIVTWKIDGILMVSITNLPGTFSTNIFFGMFDINAGSSTEPNDHLIASIYDNVRVEDVSGIVNVTASTNAAEGGSNGQFTFSRTGDTGSPLTVDFTVGGSATSGSDYTALPTSITFAVGAASTNLTVVPNNDSIAELVESVVVSLSASPNYTVGNSPATVFITDNETPELSITALSASMYERIDTDYVTFQITRRGNTNTDLTANLTYSGTGTTNFSGPASVQVGPGVVNQTFAVNPIDNSALDGNKTVTATVVSGSGYGVGATNSASGTIIDDELPAETILFADPLTSDTSANWKRNFGANNLVDDYIVDFISNLGGEPVTTPPNGSPTALKLTVNKLDVGNDAGSTNGAAGVNLYPNGQSFSGDFALRFSLYIAQNSSAGTTEFALFGINHSGNKTNWNRQTGINTFNNPPLDTDGLWFSVVSDGSGSAPGDYTLLSSTNAANPAIVLRSAAATSFTQIFKKPPYTAFAAGVPANLYAVTGPWSDVEVKKVGSIVTMSINKTPIIVYTNATAFTNGNVMLGYMDPYESVGSAGGAAYFSNVRVVQLAAPVIAPTITKIQLINGGTQVQIDFTGGAGDTTGSFKLQSSGTVNTGYLDDNTAVISSPGAGTFRFITSVGGATRFYQIRHL